MRISLRSPFIDSNGSVWLMARGQIIRVTIDQIDFIASPQKSFVHVLRIIEDSTGGLWGQTDQGFIWLRR